MADIGSWKKTGIVGGTFNPIHTGHLLLGQWAMEEAGLDGVAYIPTGNSYMKDRSEILPGEERLAMANLATSDNDRFCCLDLEMRREGNTYTYETLQELHTVYPETRLYFIVGADCLFTIDKWCRPESIFQHCTLLAASRNGMPMETLEQKRRDLERRYSADIMLLSFPNMEISSTDIRRRCAQGRSIQYLVPDSVREYIRRNHCYEGI